MKMEVIVCTVLAMVGEGEGGGGAWRGNRSSFSQAPNLTRICKSSLMLDCCTQGMSTLAACGTERGVVKG